MFNLVGFNKICRKTTLLRLAIQQILDKAESQSLSLFTLCHVLIRVAVFRQIEGPSSRFVVDDSVVKVKHRRRGTVSFVLNADHKFGSQFFITLADNLDYLDGKHCVIGIITEGIETVDALNASLVNNANEPFKDIRLV